LGQGSLASRSGDASFRLSMPSWRRRYGCGSPARSGSPKGSHHQYSNASASLGRNLYYTVALSRALQRGMFKQLLGLGEVGVVRAPIDQVTRAAGSHFSLDVPGVLHRRPEHVAVEILAVAMSKLDRQLGLADPPMPMLITIGLPPADWRARALAGVAPCRAQQTARWG
jgi:hypothetical protein